jgi:hypothetical protein
MFLCFFAIGSGRHLCLARVLHCLMGRAWYVTPTRFEHATAIGGTETDWPTKHRISSYICRPYRAAFFCPRDGVA